MKNYKNKWKNFSKEELQDICSNSTTLTEFGKKLGYSNQRAGISAAKKAIEQFNLDYSSIQSYQNVLNGKNANYGKIDYSKFRNITDIKENAPRREQLKRNLISIRGHKCERCGLSEWQDTQIPLQLHHIDGNSWNNELDNLQLLCPNCHALTDNYCKKNKKEKSKITDEEIEYALSNSHSIREASMMLGLSDGVGTLFYNRCYKLIATKGIKLLEREPAHKCSVCGKKTARANICIDCYHKNFEQKMPPRETLKNEIRNISFLALGKKYEVSDNTVREWCKKYGLPHRTKDIKRYSDKEWEEI